MTAEEKKKKDSLTPMQEAFCIAYSSCGNATEAYKAAGYETKNNNTAAASSSRLLKNPKVKRRLKELSKETNSGKIMNITEIQERLSTIGRQEIPAGLSNAERHLMIKETMKALELLAKMQGAFINRSQVEISGAIPVVIKDDI